MIHHLDNTLKELLRQELPESLASQITVSFATPDQDFPPPSVPTPAIDLFLYDVRENRDLRHSEWQIEKRDDGKVTKRRPAVRVDCSYLVTAWPTPVESGPPPIKEEHWMLSEVLKILIRHLTIPAAVLQGDLVGQEPPLPTITLQPGRLQSLGEFWQALGGKPKAALQYTVTIGVQPDAPVEAGPPVTDKQIPGQRERGGLT